MMQKNVLIFSVVGYKNSGKTTLIEKLIPTFKSLNKRVGVIKHDVHHFEIDHPGKDTYRFSQAGANRVLISSREKFAMICHQESEADLEELLSRAAGGVDILITEGYKNHPFPKIELNRTGKKEDLLCDGKISNVRALVCPFEIPGLLVPCFHPDAVLEIRDFILKFAE